MEWYFGSAHEEVTVPKHEETFDGLISSDSWPSWVSVVGNFNSQKKLNVPGVEEFFSEPMFYRSASRQQSSCERSDEQLNDLPKIEEADDIFFDSLFKVGVGEYEGSESSAQTSNWNDVMAMDFGDHIQDSTNDVSSIGDFPTEQDMEAAEFCLFEGQSDMCEDISGYISMDEPVLLELQNLTQQLADTTRVCFRDSLYRLAENSRYQTKCSQMGKENTNDRKPINRVGSSRSLESKSEDSDTKSIDRTVATLLFTTMNLCNSTSTSCPDENTLEQEYKTNSNWYHPSSPTPSSLCFVPGGDAEVPTFDSTDQQLSHTAFSLSPVKGT